jgi:hypothetical protein
VLFNGLISPAEAAISTHKRSKKNDIKIANYALTSSTSRPSSTSRRSRPARSRSPRSGLGSKAVKKPKFDFGDTVTNQDKFKQTSQVLEDTGVAAYAGQGPNLLQRPLVVDPLHQLERRPPWRHHGGGPAGAEGVRQGTDREEGPERRQEDGLHPVAG